MDKLLQIVHYLFSFFAYAYIVIVLLRFILQTVRADFYNPVSQFIVKATNPLLMPLRKVIPGLMGVDVASLVLALLLQLATIQLLFMIANATLSVAPLSALVLLSLHGLLSLVLKIYFFSFLIMVIVSWVAPHSHNPVLSVVHSITEPVIRPIRRVIPPMGGLDLSVMFAMLGLMVLSIIFEIRLL